MRSWVISRSSPAYIYRAHPASGPVMRSCFQTNDVQSLFAHGGKICVPSYLAMRLPLHEQHDQGAWWRRTAMAILQRFEYYLTVLIVLFKAGRDGCKLIVASRDVSTLYILPRPTRDVPEPISASTALTLRRIRA